MNFGKSHKEHFLDKTTKLGSHLYSGGKEVVDELGEQAKEQAHKIAKRVNEEPIPSILIAIGVGIILSGLILSKFSKRR